jgi:hypothetical protein
MMTARSTRTTAATERSTGQLLLACMLLGAGGVGLAAVVAFWPKDSNTSPLAALFLSAWSCAYLGAGVLTWRRSRHAAPTFLAAIALLLPVCAFIVPGNWALAAPGCVVVIALGLLGYWYLRRSFAYASAPVVP